MKNIIKMLISLIVVVVLFTSTSWGAVDSRFYNLLSHAATQEITNIDITSLNITPKVALDDVESIMYIDPILNNIDESFSCDYDLTTGKATVLHISYVQSMRDCSQRLCEIEDYIRTYPQTAQPQALYNYLTQNYSYDYTLQSKCIPSLLTSGKGTCAAFSMTYKKILNDLGIECYIIVSQNGSHCWNLVQGKNYDLANKTIF